LSFEGKGLAIRGMFDLFRLPARKARPAAVEQLFIECEGSNIPVAVKVRENARRMILRIDRQTGAPALTLPRGVGRIRAERFLKEHVGWIHARLKARPRSVPFADGVEIPVRGEACRIVHSLPFRGETRLANEGEARFLLVHGDPAHVASRVERFLRAEVERDLGIAVARHALALGVTIGRISVKDTRSRWGSCSSRGDLAFSWRLIFAPPMVLDYLAAHEVAHRLEMNHSVRYWRHVARIFPEFRVAETWLNRHGAGLHHFGRS
jgi:predicted metal-dependent hydrolase